MPIYEFRCLKCNESFEMLIMRTEDTVETRCPACSSENFERILSTTTHHVAGVSNSANVSSQTRNCSSGSCTTYDIPGPTG